jgi:hypothetical protein
LPTLPAKIKNNKHDLNIIVVIVLYTSSNQQTRVGAKDFYQKIRNFRDVGCKMFHDLPRFTPNSVPTELPRRRQAEPVQRSEQTSPQRRHIVPEMKPEPAPQLFAFDKQHKLGLNSTHSIKRQETPQSGHADLLKPSGLTIVDVNGHVQPLQARRYVPVESRLQRTPDNHPGRQSATSASIPRTSHNPEIVHVLGFPRNFLDEVIAVAQKKHYS